MGRLTLIAGVTGIVGLTLAGKILKKHKKEKILRRKN